MGSKIYSNCNVAETGIHYYSIACMCTQHTPHIAVVGTSYIDMFITLG